MARSTVAPTWIALACFLVVSAALVGCNRHRPRQDEPSSRPKSSSPSLAVSAPEPTAAPPGSASARSVAVPPPAPTVDARILFAGDACTSEPRAHLSASPRVIRAGEELRILATSHGAPPDAVLARAPDGTVERLAFEPRLGPPASAFARLTTHDAGTYRLVVARGAAIVACADVRVASADERVPLPRDHGHAPWLATRDWTEADEDLYAAWIEKLFDAPLTEQPSYDALHRLTADADKNFLWGHLGRDEDAPPPRGLRLDPDCADLPYFLRAYFAWKQGLPLGFSSCTRGTASRPPTCLRRFSSLEAMDAQVADPVRRFERFVRGKLADTVHSGTGRTKADDDETDYYPIRLSRETLRPGVIYADPFGHVLVVAKVIPESSDAGGILLAVDGQPDGTVGRKRFWEGNFLFSLDEIAMGSPGFKRFRKIERAGGTARPVANGELARDPAYADYGTDQYAGGARELYDLVDDVLSPVPRDPEQALRETIQALEEQVTTRVTSVGNGEARFQKKTSVIEMPKGTSLFETTGDWEDFSTPSRDMRLLIAIDVATGFPERFARRPQRYHAISGQSVDDTRRLLGELLQKELTQRKVTYTRSDGSPQELTLAEVVARQKALEMAYNPNDCVELRWGASAKSSELGTCRRRAPADQRQLMEKARPWFASRKRPARQ